MSCLNDKNYWSIYRFSSFNVIFFYFAQYTPYLEVKDESLHGNERYHGYVADFTKILSERVGFHYVIKLVKDGKYGQKERNGEWTGMIGEVIRKVKYLFGQAFF